MARLHPSPPYIIDVEARHGARVIGRLTATTETTARLGELMGDLARVLIGPPKQAEPEVPLDRLLADLAAITDETIAGLDELTGMGAQIVLLRRAARAELQAREVCDG